MKDMNLMMSIILRRFPVVTEDRKRFNVHFDLKLKRKGKDVHLAFNKTVKQKRVTFVGFSLQSGWLHLTSWRDKLAIGIRIVFFRH
jgi:hypothetical protein